MARFSDARVLGAFALTLTLLHSARARGDTPAAPAEPTGTATSSSSGCFDARAHKLRTAGKIAFWSGYGASAAVGLFAGVLAPAVGALAGGHCSPECQGSSTQTSHYLPLLLPVVGPVWSLVYGDVNDSWSNILYLGLFEAAQLTGLTLYWVGKSNENSDHSSSSTPRVSVLPARPSAGAGVVVLGTF